MSLELGGNVDGSYLLDTLVAINPAVAIPVSTAQQITAIQAEQSAHAGQ